MSDFSATPLEKLVQKLGSPNPDIRKHLQRFETMRKTTDFNALKLAYENTPLCVDQTQLQNMLAKHQDPTQPLFIDLYNRRDFTVANDLTETGFEAGSTARFAVTKQGLVAVKITIDLANLKRWDAYTEDPAEKWQLEYEYLTTQAFLDLMQALNNQVVAYLDSIKAPAGGAGTRFVTAAAGDYKEIPSTEADVLYRKMRTESRENRFGRAGKPYVLGSLVMAENLEDINSYGPNNQRNLREQLDWFTPMDTDSLLVPDPVADDAIMYLVDAGGLFAESWVYDYNVPEYYKMENERWDAIQMPPIVEGMPPIKIGYKDTLSKTDDFATFNIEESRINRRFTAMFWTNLVLGRAHSSVAGDSPVVAYLLKK
jgi:hypothetical protein